MGRFRFGQMLEVLLVLGAIRGIGVMGRGRMMMGAGGRRWWRWDAVWELGRVELLHFDKGLGGVRQMVLELMGLMVVWIEGVMVELGGGGLICVTATLASHGGCCLVGIGVTERRETECARVVGCCRAIVVGRRSSFVLEDRCK